MRPVAMVGAGMIPFGELFDQGMKEMLPRAVQAALDSVDNGLERSQIEAAWFGQLETAD
jgi:acetyl-CoA C-acetyltransferase